MYPSLTLRVGILFSASYPIIYRLVHLSTCRVKENVTATTQDTKWKGKLEGQIYQATGEPTSKRTAESILTSFIANLHRLASQIEVQVYPEYAIRQDS